MRLDSLRSSDEEAEIDVVLWNQLTAACRARRRRHRQAVINQVWRFVDTVVVVPKLTATAAAVALRQHRLIAAAQSLNMD